MIYPFKKRDSFIAVLSELFTASHALLNMTAGKRW